MREREVKTAHALSLPVPVIRLIGSPRFRPVCVACALVACTAPLIGLVLQLHGYAVQTSYVFDSGDVSSRVVEISLAVPGAAIIRYYPDVRRRSGWTVRWFQDELFMESFVPRFPITRLSRDRVPPPYPRGINIELELTFGTIVGFGLVLLVGSRLLHRVVVRHLDRSAFPVIVPPRAADLPTGKGTGWKPGNPGPGTH